VLLVLLVEATVIERVAGIDSPVRTDGNVAGVLSRLVGR